MKRFTQQALALSFLVFLNGCVTVSPKDPAATPEAPVTSDLTLDKVDGINLREVNIKNVTSYFGEPDLKGLAPNSANQELYIYFNNENPRSTRLTLTFDAKTKNVILAKWFVLPKDPESDFSAVQSRYSKDKLNTKKPLLIKDDIFGFPADLYRSPVSPLQVAVNKRTKKVGALAWFMPVKRK